jgi:hypothetical protein
MRKAHSGSLSRLGWTAYDTLEKKERTSFLKKKRPARASK